MDSLLRFALEAHGGLSAWDKLQSLRANVSIGGALWDLKQIPGLFKNTRVELKLRYQHVVTHLVDVAERIVFTPNRISLESESGKMLAEGSRRGAVAFPPVDYNRAYDALDVMRGVAETHSVSVAQIALAWLLHQKVVSSVVVGAKRMEQLEDNLRAVNVSLTDEEQVGIAEVSKIPAEYPGWMIELWSHSRRTQVER